MKIERDRFRRALAYVFAALASLPMLADKLWAGTTIAYGSSVGVTNLTSSGAPMPEGFVFQLGTFEGGFVPDPSNTDGWLGAWRPASDREGEPLAGNSAAYQTQLLGGVFPPEMRANCFTGSLTLDHNEPPFDLGGQLYIWGYDQRVTAGAAEWILITDPGWKWPDGSSNLPAISYAVSGASIVVLGDINGEGYEMRSAAVTVPASSASLYEGWLAQNFSAGVLGDEALEAEVWGDHADPDGDGLSNLLEYFTANDPNLLETVSGVGQPMVDGDKIVVAYRRSLSATGVVGQMEWSKDLQSWSRDGIVQTTVDENATHANMRASWPMGEARQAFFRLTVQREP